MKNKKINLLLLKMLFILIKIKKVINFFYNNFFEKIKYFFKVIFVNLFIFIFKVFKIILPFFDSTLNLIWKLYEIIFDVLMYVIHVLYLIIYLPILYISKFIKYVYIKIKNFVWRIIWIKFNLKRYYYKKFIPEHKEILLSYYYPIRNFYYRCFDRWAVRRICTYFFITLPESFFYWIVRRKRRIRQFIFLSEMILRYWLRLGSRKFFRIQKTRIKKTWFVIKRIHLYSANFFIIFSISILLFCFSVYLSSTKRIARYKKILIEEYLYRSSILKHLKIYLKVNRHFFFFNYIGKYFIFYDIKIWLADTHHRIINIFTYSTLRRLVKRRIWIKGKKFSYVKVKRLKFYFLKIVKKKLKRIKKTTFKVFYIKNLWVYSIKLKLFYFYKFFFFVYTTLNYTFNCIFEWIF